jgi:cytochrome P450
MSQASQGEHPGLQNLEWYRTMRDNEPVWRDPKTGLWNVFRYEDVTAVLADYRTFSSDFSQFFPLPFEEAHGPEGLEEGDRVVGIPSQLHKVPSVS